MGKENVIIMKNRKFWAAAFALGNLFLFNSTVGCDNSPTTEACLLNGDPECNNLPGTGGGTCYTNPYYNQPCSLPDGGTGHYSCDAQGGLVCTSNGSGGSGGGNGTCSDDPNLNHPCTDPHGGTGHWTCTSDGLMCTGGNGTGGDGGGGSGPYNCASDPNNGHACTTPQGGPGKWGCNSNGTALYCYPNGSGGTGGGDAGSGGGGGGGPYNCHNDPGLYAPCYTSNGHIGVEVCNEAGTGLVCQCTDTNCGNGGTGGGGTGGSGPYNCASDPQLGNTCQMGTGVCTRNGTKVCNPAGDGLKCSAVAGPANPLGEICSNGLDDDCDGAVDEPSCTHTGGSGSGGDAGTGSGGDSGSGTGGSGGGGTGGSGGGVTCTTVSTASILVTGSSSLTTLLKGDASISSANPLSMGSFANLQLLSIAAGNGLSITTSTVGAQMNVWAPHTGGGGDPMPLIDALFCRQLGINPPNPASCNAGVIGDRKSAAYLSALRIDWECWRKGSSFCPSTINGYVPGDLFALIKIIAVGDGDSESFNGSSKWRILEMPPKCP